MFVVWKLVYRLDISTVLQLIKCNLRRIDWGHNLRAVFIRLSLMRTEKLPVLVDDQPRTRSYAKLGEA